MQYLRISISLDIRQHRCRVLSEGADLPKLLSGGRRKIFPNLLKLLVTFT
jgi:hypothetical protein